MRRDPTECHDLAAEHPDQLRELVDALVDARPSATRCSRSTAARSPSSCSSVPSGCRRARATSTCPARRRCPRRRRSNVRNRSHTVTADVEIPAARRRGRAARRRARCSAAGRSIVQHGAPALRAQLRRRSRSTACVVHARARARAARARLPLRAHRRAPRRRDAAHRRRRRRHGGDPALHADPLLAHRRRSHLRARQRVGGDRRLRRRPSRSPAHSSASSSRSTARPSSIPPAKRRWQSRRSEALLPTFHHGDHSGSGATAHWLENTVQVTLSPICAASSVVKQTPSEPPDSPPLVPGPN